MKLVWTFCCHQTVTEFEVLLLPLDVLPSHSLHGLSDIDVTGPEAKLSVSTGQGWKKST